MTLSYQYKDFEHQARDLAAASGKLGDGWELKHVRTTDGPEMTAFLAKSLTQMVEFEEPDEEALETQGVIVGSDGKFGDDDPATCSSSNNFPANGKHSVAVYFEYHVIYSPTYQVPVLYFTASYSSGKQLPLEKVWQLLSPVHTKGGGMKWGLVTQQEHPLFSRPFYHIHPCHTATVMERAVQPHRPRGGGEGGRGGDSSTESKEGVVWGVSSDRNPPNHYLLSWLSMFGPVVGLSVPLRYLQTTA